MYSFKSRVRYSEVGLDGRLGMAGIINYFQDCSTFQSEDIGMGISYLKETNRCWLLSSWQVMVERYPDLGETITIGTWAYDFKGFYGYRNFIMKDAQGILIACANSVWINYNIETKRPVKIIPQQIKDYQMEEKLDMPYTERKIKMPDDMSKKEAYIVQKHHIDTNNHVNNGQYIQMAMEFVPENLTIRKIRVEYKKSAIYQDKIIPYVKEEAGMIKVALMDIKGKPNVLLELS